MGYMGSDDPDASKASHEPAVTDTARDDPPAMLAITGSSCTVTVNVSFKDPTVCPPESVVQT